MNPIDAINGRHPGAEGAFLIRIPISAIMRHIILQIGA
jgi:hypothetical protein